MANKLSSLDMQGVIRSAYDDQLEGLKFLTGSSLVPEEYDELVLSYTAGDLTGVVYKKNTVTVATLTLSYTAGDLTGVVRS